MTRIATYLINLDGSDARLASATAAMTAQGLTWERVSAVDGRGRAPESFAEYDDAACLRYSGRRLRGPEIGCYLSHLEALRRFLAGDADLALILEDDIILRTGFAEALARIAALHAAGTLGRWGIMNLKNPAKRQLTPVADLVTPGATYRLCRAHYFPVATTAMLWTRAAAAEFLAFGPIIAPVDQRIRDWMTKTDLGLGFPDPTPAHATEAPSDIDVPGGSRKRREATLRQYVARQWRLGLNRMYAARHAKQARRHDGR